MCSGPVAGGTYLDSASCEASCSVNSAPTPPIINGPTTGNPNINYTFNFLSYDYDGDQIRYIIDWDNNGTEDQILPLGAYVDSGTILSANNNWAGTGAKTFQALAQDIYGRKSIWRSFTINLSLCDPAAIGINRMTGCAYSGQNFETLNTTAPNGLGLSSPAPSAATPLPFTKWGGGGPGALADNFSVRWKGKFRFTAGNYIFSTNSDDGSRAYFDDDNNGLPDTGYLVNDWGLHGFQLTSGASVAVSAGEHTLVYEMYENTGASGYGLSWTSSVPAAPNLTASNPSPTLATAGTPVTFSATISNVGDASTGVGFTNLFQTSPVSDGSSGVVDYPATGMPALAAGGTAVASKSVTFAAAGVIYVRACADKSSAGDANGVISESNEGDNCSSWTSATISPAAPSPATVWINADQNSLPYINTGTQINWGSSNATLGSCTVSHSSVIDWTGESGSNKSTGSIPYPGRTYTLTCSPFGTDSSKNAGISIQPQLTFSLTVKTSGQGTVKSDLPGINCGPSCQATYTEGTTVTLTAKANTGRIFTGWAVQGGGSCPSRGACSVLITGNKTVTAIFSIDPNYKEF
jgi:hypothetical protein